MTVKPQDGLVRIGQQVQLYVKELAGKRGVIIDKRLVPTPSNWAGSPDDLALGYRIRITPPAPHVPATIWCCRFEFEAQ